MVQKRISCNFFKFNEPEGYEGKIDELLSNQKTLLNSDKVHNVKVSGVILRITFLEKGEDSSNHWWKGIVERLDTSEQGEISNLEGEKSIYAQAEDEGPIINTGFVYYPLTNTVVLHRKIGGVNDTKFGIFIRKLLKESEIIKKNFTKFKMDVLPDLHKLDRLGKANSIKTLEYSFALPEDISALKKEERGIFGDMFLANRLGGERMRVSIRASEMNMQQTLKKVKELMKLDRDDVGSLRAIAEHDDIEEPLDLLSKKFSDHTDVNLKKGQKETVVLIMDTIEQMFVNQKKLLHTMYINQSEDGD